MNRKTVLITGGAGFIGSHLTDELLRQGYRVRILDLLAPQVHGENARRPSYLAADADLVLGDVRDPDAVRRCLKGVEMVVHLAAAVGVGQSMYQISGYTSSNNLGTANLLEALAARPVERLVVASSMSIYGEGLYQREDGTIVHGTDRAMAQLRARHWELRDETGQELRPVPTPESKHPSLASVYALSKFDQEQMCLIVGKAYNIPTAALRFFNVYGPRQALSNPYTDVLAIFAARLLGGEPPMIFEDGRQNRDFVHVHDVARALRLALEAPDGAGRAYNIGSGRRLSVLEVALELGRAINREDLTPQVTQRYRCGDVRHCFADISLARRVLGYRPRVAFDQGLAGLAEWLAGQVLDKRFAEARQEMLERELTV